MLYKDIGKG